MKEAKITLTLRLTHRVATEVLLYLLNNEKMTRQQYIKKMKQLTTK